VAWESAPHHTHHKFEPSFFPCYTHRLSPPCSGLPPFVPTTSFLTPQTPITGHTEPQGTRLLPRGGGPFRPRPSRCTNGTWWSCRGSCMPHPVYARTGPSLIPPLQSTGRYVIPPPPPPYCTLTPPLLCPAPRLCTNGVSTRVTQGQGHRVTFRIGLTIIAYFAHMCRCLALSAVSSHVLVLLLIIFGLSFKASPSYVYKLVL
jgi:hypothetical protein